MKKFIFNILLSILSSLSFSQTAQVQHGGTGQNTATKNYVLSGLTANSYTAVPYYKTCMIVVGSDDGGALLSADLTQFNRCKVNLAGVIKEITIAVDNASSTTSVLVQKRHCATFTSGQCSAFTLTNLTSAALPATSVANADACATVVASQACLDGATSSGSVTISSSSLVIGDWIGLASGTADGTTKRVSVSITWGAN